MITLRTVHVEIKTREVYVDKNGNQNSPLYATLFCQSLLPGSQSKYNMVLAHMDSMISSPPDNSMNVQIIMEINIRPVQ